MKTKEKLIKLLKDVFVASGLSVVHVNPVPVKTKDGEKVNVTDVWQVNNKEVICIAKIPGTRITFIPANGSPSRPRQADQTINASQVLDESSMESLLKAVQYRVKADNLLAGKKKSKSGHKIKIIGSGSSKEIIAALRGLADSIEKSDFPKKDEDDNELEDAVLMTTIGYSEDIEDDTY